jgi:hypothetical protein
MKASVGACGAHIWLRDVEAWPRVFHSQRKLHSVRSYTYQVPTYDKLSAGMWMNYVAGNFVIDNKNSQLLQVGISEAR